MVGVFSAVCQLLPPSVEIRMPMLVMSTLVLEPGWTAYSITIFPHRRSVKAVFDQVVPLFEL